MFLISKFRVLANFFRVLLAPLADFFRIAAIKRAGRTLTTGNPIPDKVALYHVQLMALYSWMCWCATIYAYRYLANIFILPRKNRPSMLIIVFDAHRWGMTVGKCWFVFVFHFPNGNLHQILPRLLSAALRSWLKSPEAILWPPAVRWVEGDSTTPLWVLFSPKLH